MGLNVLLARLLHHQIFDLTTDWHVLDQGQKGHQPTTTRHQAAAAKEDETSATPPRTAAPELVDRFERAVDFTAPGDPMSAGEGLLLPGSCIPRPPHLHCTTVPLLSWIVIISLRLVVRRYHALSPSTLSILRLFGEPLLSTRFQSLLPNSIRSIFASHLVVPHLLGFLLEICFCITSSFPTILFLLPIVDLQRVKILLCVTTFKCKLVVNKWKYMRNASLHQLLNIFSAAYSCKRKAIK